METLSNIVDTIQEKLGKEESAKISDSLANILVIEEANGNLLLHQAQAKEEESFFNEGKREEKSNEPFDFRSVFDEKGKFKR